MMNHLLNYLIWYCCNISSSKCAVCNMYWISYTCTDNLCLKIIVSKYICNILNKIKPGYAILIIEILRNESTAMAPITLTSTYTPNETTIPNIFLDRYMPSANGEFVKVYLCLLRMYANPAGRSSTLTDIADLLNHTESDIIRAIKYWEKAGLL